MVIVLSVSFSREEYHARFSESYLVVVPAASLVLARLKPGPSGSCGEGEGFGCVVSSAAGRWVQLRIMLKRVASKYGAMILLVTSIVVVLCLSRYARGGMASWVEIYTWPGGVNVCALLLTLVVIAWQSTETRDAAKAANAQIQIMKDKDRGQLIIRTMDEPEITGSNSFIGGSCALRVRVFVENIGSSKAINIRAYGILDIVSTPTGGSHESGFLQVFPHIIDNGETRHPLNVGGFGREFEGVASTGDYIAISEETAQRLRDGKDFIKATGVLIYQDIFKDSHTTPFHFVWKSVGDDDGGKWLTRSFWVDSSPVST